MNARKFMKNGRLTNLANILNRVKYYGVGRKVARAIWANDPQPTYFTITRVIFKHDMYHAKAWGTFTFQGKAEDKVKKIKLVRKKDWFLLPLEEGEVLDNPFARRKHSGQ